MTRSQVTYQTSFDLKEQIKRVIAFKLGDIYKSENILTPPKLTNYLSKHFPGASKPMRDKVFVSYSHHDKEWLDKLRTHLSPFEAYKELKVWSDTDIKGGQKWFEEIQQALKTAKVAVLLVTPNFLASAFIKKQELPEFLKASEEDGLTIMWIAVSSSSFKVSPLEPYECANDPNRPLDQLPDAFINAELVKICEKIEAAFL